MKKKWLIASCLLLTLCIAAFILLARKSFVSPTTSSLHGQKTFFAMDTVMTLNIPDANDNLLQQCVKRVAELEALLSVTDEQSEIARLNRDKKIMLSPDTENLLHFGLNMGQDTNGALDITLYPIIRAWGFTTGEYRIPTNTELAELLRHVDYSSIILQDECAQIPAESMVDLGSIAKGYATDELVRLLQAESIRSGLLDLGGNLYCMGTKADGTAWRIALKDPLGTNWFAALSVTDCAVVTSGCYERYFEGEDGVLYGHIFSPEDGNPVDNGILSVTVLGKNATLCDALSTALFVMGQQEATLYLQQRTDVEAVLLCENEQILVTDGLKDSFSPLGSYQQWDILWIKRTEGIQ